MRYNDVTAGPKAMYNLGDNVIFQIYTYSANILTSVQIHNIIFLCQLATWNRITQECAQIKYISLFLQTFHCWVQLLMSENLNAETSTIS